MPVELIILFMMAAIHIGLVVFLYKKRHDILDSSNPQHAKWLKERPLLIPSTIIGDAVVILLGIYQIKPEWLPL